ncbi:MAG: YlbF family regulator [Phycisphaerae bacterium]
MSAVTELAGRLGQAIADSPEAKTLNDARKQLEADEGLRTTMEQFGQQMEKVHKLEQENKPIEPEDKKKLAELEKVLAASEKFKKFSAAQVNFYDMMRKVNQAIREKIAELE